VYGKKILRCPMFKTFPEFSKLTLGDKEEYEELIKGYPPISSYSFADLMTWWNALGYGSVSMLNGNLIIPYWIPGDDHTSGLSLIGTNKIDESICTIFDRQRFTGESPRLVNVPEFVISSVQYPEIFTFTQQRDYDEYLIKMSDQYPLDNMKSIWRYKIKRKLKNIKEEVSVKQLDLSKRENKDLLIHALGGWQAKNINNYGKIEQEGAILAIDHAVEIGANNICLFVGEELYGFCIYVQHANHEVAIYCIKATHSKALGYELVLYYFVQWFVENGVELVNINADYGLMRLRMFMLTFGPTNFHRKYTIQPNDGRKR
jgi:hypothetical protein